MDTPEPTPDGAPPRFAGPARQADVEATRRYVRENRERYTREALGSTLRAANYPEYIIRQALEEFDPIEQVGPDLRNRATWILLGTFGATWLFLSWRIEEVSRDQEMASLWVFAAAILGVLLLVVLLPSIWWVRRHRKLAAGVPGAFVTALIVPFMFWLAITGTCIAQTRPFGP